MNSAVDSTTEEEFLYQLNLSKCDKIFKHIVKKHPNTRSKSKLKRATYNKTSSYSSNSQGKTPRKLSISEKISRLKTANSKQQCLFNSTKRQRTQKSLARDENVCNGELPIEDTEDNITGFCRICRRAYSSRKEKIEHFKSPNHVVIVEAKKGTNYEALKEEGDVFKSIKYPSKCSMCGEGPLARREFLIHHRRHAEVYPYHCVRCKSKFYRRCDLLRHIRVHLGANPRFKCPRCPCVLTKRSSITAHLILKHKLPDTRPRNYKCTECGRAFISKQDVDRHMRIHTGHIPARCDVCGKGFSSLPALETHKRIHSGETPFKCDQCPYVSKCKQLLARHLRTHSGEKPYRCQQCPYVCSNSSGLKRHMMKHSGSKPFKCPYCNYRSSNIENLRKHVKKTRKHKGLNVYPCQHCSFSTDESAQYLKHLKQQHFPYLDEENSSATKLSGILLSKSDEQPQNGAVDTTVPETTTDTTSLHPVPSLSTLPDEPPTIEMVIVSDPSTLSHTVSPVSSNSFLPSNSVDKLRPAVVSAIDEILLSALMKIPNLQQVILPHGDGNAPVTLVIGSDQSPYEAGEDNLSSSTAFN